MPMAGRARARFAAENAFRDGVEVVCSAIRPGANYNMRLRRISDATACGSPSSATSSGPPSEVSAPTPDDSRNTSSIAGTRCRCSRRTLHPTLRRMNRSRRIFSCDDSRRVSEATRRTTSCRGLLKMAASSRIPQARRRAFGGLLLLRNGVRTCGRAHTRRAAHLHAGVHPEPRELAAACVRPRHGAPPGAQRRSCDSAVRARARVDARRRVRGDIQHGCSIRRRLDVVRARLRRRRSARAPRDRPGREGAAVCRQSDVSEGRLRLPRADGEAARERPVGAA